MGTLNASRRIFLRYHLLLEMAISRACLTGRDPPRIFESTTCLLYRSLGWNTEFRFYRASTGEVPVQAFLDLLKPTNAGLYKLVLAGIAKLRVRGNHGRPLTAPVKGSMAMLELRVGGADIARVFFFFRPNRELVCTHGYVKKSQKLDPREIARAERYKEDWEQRFPRTM